MKISPPLQEKIKKRLLYSFDDFYETHGAGIAGTTAAHFVAGNRGFRFPDYGGDKLRNIFPNETDLREYEASISSIVRTRKDIVD